MKNNNRLLTPQKRAQGLGSAHSGTHHWWMQRVTAVALVPLVLWFVWSVQFLFAQGTHTAIAHWMHSPFNALLLAALILAGLYHGMLGLQVIVEDYVHCPAKKFTLLIAHRILIPLVGLLALMAIFTLHSATPVVLLGEAPAMETETMDDIPSITLPPTITPSLDPES